MCTTNQVLFVCSHQATHRFRTSVCRQANRGRCKICDATEILSFPCMDCEAIVKDKRRKCGDGRHRPFQEECPLPNRLLNTTWHVPSRCFVDRGVPNSRSVWRSRRSGKCSSDSCTAA